MKPSKEINKDLISIIIPYYKKKKYILKTINSILNQSYNQFEIIIIYDDENLSDLDYLEKLFKLEKKIKIIKNSKNIGAGFSRNKGIENAKGEFIAFIDCDDLWYQDFLSGRKNFFQNKDYKFSYSNFYYYFEKSNRKKVPKKNITLKSGLIYN